jgi:hypothetical protein
MENTSGARKSKAIAIGVLTAVSVLIAISGAALSIHSILNHVSFKVLGSDIHGAVFGLVILFLGARYYLSVQKLKARVYRTTTGFSFSNFKKQSTPL